MFPPTPTRMCTPGPAGWDPTTYGPDGKVYSVRAGDRIGDGVIRTVTAQAVVILQVVNDPLSLEKQREVRKLLRGGEEVK